MASNKKMITIDGNTAAAHIAYAFSEVAAIYPITPSSPMGEYSDEWAAAGRKNLFGETVKIAEMQSEAGAAGAVHGSLSAGALTSTFTASQGLLLMIPNMYKIAGEMLPSVFHVSARSLAAQSLSIFGDHSDVMSCRATGFAMTAASNIQETMDMSLVAHLATLECQVPFLSFFDGFRTSHEVQKVEEISYEDIKTLVNPEYITRFKNRALRPEAPSCKVAAQNADVYFQGRETTNKIYNEIPAMVQKYMDQVAGITGRPLHLFDYVGAPDATKVIIAMGSACDTIELTVNYLLAKGEKVGLVKVRLYRPFDVAAINAAIPASAKMVIVLDRTKEPGSYGEPLFLDVQAALVDRDVKVIGGRYGLSSKEFEPTHVKAIYDYADAKGEHNFTVGIEDDVTFRSIPVTDIIDVTADDVTSCMFWGLGSDGTVGANKDSIKIIGTCLEDINSQAYFAYDSKKSGGITTSHLRFGKSSVNMPWLITAADFVACHVPAYIGRYDMAEALKPNGTFLLNSEWPTNEVFSHFPRSTQEYIINNNIKVYNINALKIAESVGLGKRISTVMQSAFFNLSGIIPAEQALEQMKYAATKKFSRKGESIVSMNHAAIEAGFNAVEQVTIPSSIADIKESYVAPALVPADADTFAKNIIEKSMKLKGDTIPVSHMAIDGILPTATAKLEKRAVAPQVPEWIAADCIQCNQCAQACPHAALRPKKIEMADMANAPENFGAVALKPVKDGIETQYKLQVFIKDCQGCGVCIDVCPKNALSFVDYKIAYDKGEFTNEQFFTALPENVIEDVTKANIKDIQFRQPLFEFSGACAGCGETPYVKLATQLFGERMVIANATGCSSIYGGTFPTVPYCKRPDGRGPAWANSLFEDNAEYGFGMRLAIDSNRELLTSTVERVLANGTTAELTAALNASMALWTDKTEAAIQAQNAVAAAIPAAIAAEKDAAKSEVLAKLDELKDYFVDKSLWIVGGDGWAYDIGYGGLDHVVSQDKNVNILVLDTEVYSNTGGQASKATPIAAVAKFAATGMRLGKKKMPFMCMTYGNVYVASIAMGANRAQTQKAFQEAEAWDGPSIIFAYAPCINHGIKMSQSQTRMKLAVECGYWPLFRYNPANEEGKKYVFESKEPAGSYQDFIQSEVRYTSLKKMVAPEEADQLYVQAEEDAKARWDFYKALGSIL